MHSVSSSASKDSWGDLPFGYKARSDKVYFRGSLALVVRKTSGISFPCNFLLNNHDLFCLKLYILFNNDLKIVD